MATQDNIAAHDDMTTQDSTATRGTTTANTSVKKSAKIEVHFRPLTDPRRRRPVYPLINIVVIAICAVICGADDLWELYDTRSDSSLVDNLAASRPRLLAELQEVFMKEAAKNHALPIDDRVIERANAAFAGRPDLMAGRTLLTLAEGMTGMSENVFLNIKNKSKTITAELEVPKERINGAILVQGGRFGGWALYVKDGVPAYDYNFLGLERFTVAAAEKLQPGKATIRFDFAYDGGGLGKGGMGTLYVNDRKVAQGRIERTQPMLFSADETADVGMDLATPVVEAIGSEAKSRFTGRIHRVTIAVRDVDLRAEAAVKRACAVVQRQTE